MDRLDTIVMKRGYSVGAQSYICCLNQLEIGRNYVAHVGKEHLSVNLQVDAEGGS
jgi:hypothetical protein